MNKRLERRTAPLITLTNDFSVESVKDRERWDNFVAGSPHGHFLQSFGWGELKGAFGWVAERLALVKQGQIVAGAQVLFRKTPLGRLAYIPRGPVANLKDNNQAIAVFRALHKLARRKGSMFLKIEPNCLEQEDHLVHSGFRRSPQVIQPKATFIVDLETEIQTVAAHQKSKTRYNIGLATRKGVEIRLGTTNDLPTFYRLLEETSRRDRFSIHNIEYYRKLFESPRKNLELLLASYKDEILAGIVVAFFGQEDIYLYGASGNSHRNLMPNHLIQWEAMKIAKSRGCTRYDLWGIPDIIEGETDEKAANSPDPLGGVHGLYRFKEGFGGRLVRYPGAFDYVYSKWRYWLWLNLIPRIQRLRA